MPDPTFFVIGAAKCGTTTICDLLAAHPQVFMSSPKEPHFFSRLATYNELHPWYESLFEDGTDTEARGEGSTSYTHPNRVEFVAPRIRDNVPNARLIYMVRHPVRRLESDWKMRLREGRASTSIADAVDWHGSLITFGLYWKHLSVYREYFDDDQLLVVFLEDFSEDPQRELQRVYRHVGVDPLFIPDDPARERNAASDFRHDSWVATALRAVPGFKRVKEAAPRWSIETLKLLLTRDRDPVPDWDEDTLDLVESYFREDSKQLLSYCDKDPDFWDLHG